MAGFETFVLGWMGARQTPWARGARPRL